MQPGYQALEGPAESRYGYTCPTVVDWNGDGTLDIVMTDGTAKHTVFLGRASEGGPRLKPGQPLYNDGLELHGPWRVKPGIAKVITRCLVHRSCRADMRCSETASISVCPDYHGTAQVNGRQTYIMIDDADDLHAFYRIDDYNLKDAGKVRLRTGKPIRTHFLAGGATGRIHINLVDWDLDNVFDLLLSVPRHASVPDADLGLPSSQVRHELAAPCSQDPSASAAEGKLKDALPELLAGLSVQRDPVPPRRQTGGWQDARVQVPRGKQEESRSVLLPSSLPVARHLRLCERTGVLTFPLHGWMLAQVMHFDGVPIAIGAQDGAVTPITGIGKTVGPHLLVGEESGRLILYERSRLSCESYNRFPTMKDAKKKAVETADGLEPLSWDEAIG